ncbi:MAG TPA: glycosyltransferase family 4 protein [Longimicrobiaceae bacterium]|nr:glycosyltransferase family 4 protein [Longimicrobiaceae bacterium]
MTLRVLFVSHSLPPPHQPLANLGGMQRLAMETRAALAAHPDVQLSVRTLESSWRWTGLRTAPFLARLLWEIPRVVRRESIDVVLFSSMVTAALAPMLRPRLRGTGVALAVTPVGRDVTLPNSLHQRLVPSIFRALDLVLPISRATGDECLARGLTPERMRVLPCGVDLSRFETPDEDGSARAELLSTLAKMGEAPIPDDALLLCSVGRHQERKGFHWFVRDVMPHLPERVVYLLGGEGPMLPVIRRAVEDRGLGERVRLLGRLPEETLLRLYRGADLFVMPNVPVSGDIEGFGIVMLEAGLSGTPVIAADLEGIRDVVTPGENGELAPPLDAEGFARTIGRLLDDPDALAALSRSASAHTAERFGWPGVADRMVRLLRAARPSARSEGA